MYSAGYTSSHSWLDDAYSVGTPKWAFWEKSGQTHCKTTFTPTGWRVLLVSNGFFLFSGVVVWMFHIGRARHPGPGWLTSGDMATDSGVQVPASNTLIL